MLKKIVLFIIILISLLYVTNILYSQTNPTDITKLLERLVELSDIPEDKRTIEEWKEIIKIILLISKEDLGSIQILISQLNLEIESYKSLIDIYNNTILTLNKSIKELDKLKLQYSEALSNLEDTLLLYNTYIENVSSKPLEYSYNYLFTTIGISNNGYINIGINYMYNWSYILFGGGVGLLNILNINSQFGFSINLNVGLRF